MAIRCSLLGHDFGDSEVEREREERGSEVVVTIREVKECSRCGETKLVSENKEVTSIGTAPGADGSEADAADRTDASEATVDASTGASAGPDAQTDGEASDDGETNASDGDEAPVPERDDAEILEAGPEDVDAPDATRAAATVADGEDAETIDDDDAEAPEDDAVIIDDAESADRERGHGEWPEADDVTESGGNADATWPDVGGAGDGVDPDESAVERGRGGRVPSREPDASGERLVESAESGGGEQSATGFASADSAPTPVEATAAEATEYVCPACGYSTAGSGSSLRAGDICPECRGGYLADR